MVKKMEWMSYPACERQETGCKVGWRFYRSEDAANRCAVAARHNAFIQRYLGYDFGYQSPGSIDEEDGTFKVCIP